MKCSKCGFENPMEGKFCIKCGNSLNDSNLLNNLYNNNSITNNMSMSNENNNSMNTNVFVGNDNNYTMNNNTMNKNTMNNNMSMRNNNNIKSTGLKTINIFGKAIDFKVFIIGCVVIVILFFLLLFVILFGGSSSHKNTTGSSDYKDSDVGLNCVIEDSSDDRTAVLYDDVLYNYDGFQSVVYSKYEFVYKDLTDEKFVSLVESFDIDCDFMNDCTKDSFSSTSSFSLDTKVERNGNTVILTGMQQLGVGKKASNSDKEDLKEELVKSGMTCN